MPHWHAPPDCYDHHTATRTRRPALPHLTRRCPSLVYHLPLPGWCWHPHRILTAFILYHIFPPRWTAAQLHGTDCLPFCQRWFGSAASSGCAARAAAQRLARLRFCILDWFCGYTLPAGVYHRTPVLFLLDYQTIQPPCRLLLWFSNRTAVGRGSVSWDGATFIPPPTADCRDVVVPLPDDSATARWLYCRLYSCQTTVARCERLRCTPRPCCVGCRAQRCASPVALDNTLRNGLPVCRCWFNRLTRAARDARLHLPVP